MGDKLNKLLKQYTKENPKLSDMLSDNIFFKAYPEFKNVKVKFDEYLDSECLYDHASKTLYVDKNCMGTPELNVTLAGEMQKMIQYAEGFARAYPMREVVPPETYDKINEPIERAEMLEIYKDIDPRGYKYKRDDYHRKYGFFPEDVPRTEYEKEEFRLSLLKGRMTGQQGNEEIINVKERFGLSANQRNSSGAEFTEIIPRGDQVAYPTKGKFKEALKGPIDYIKRRTPWKGSEPTRFNMMDLLKLPYDEGLPNN
jgi:hypothetical protein